MDNPQKSNPKKPNPSQKPNSSQKYNSSQKRTPTHRNSELNFPLPSESQMQEFWIRIPEYEILTDDPCYREKCDLLAYIEALCMSWNSFLKELYKFKMY